jgi:hypothetical protein
MLSAANRKKEEGRTAWPTYKNSDGHPIEFIVELSKRGDIPSGISITAYVDDSQQYKAEGKCWRATSSSKYVKIGQRIEKEHVVRWQEASTK